MNDFEFEMSILSMCVVTVKQYYPELSDIEALKIAIKVEQLRLLKEALCKATNPIGG